MKRHVSLLLVLLLLLALPALAQRPVTLDDLMRLKAVGAQQLSPDGKRVAYTVSQADFDENVFRSNIFLVDSSGGTPTKLTNSLRRDTSPRWSPDGKWIAFLSDRDNRPEKIARTQIWVISPDGGEAWQLTREKVNIQSFHWSPDGKRIALVAAEGASDEEEKRKREKDDALVTESDLRPARIYLASVPDGKTELLYSSKRHISSISFSPKGDEIAFADQPTPKVPDGFFSVVRVVDVNTKQVRELAGGSLSNRNPEWSPDGKYIAFIGGPQNDWAANNNLYIAPASGGSARNLSAEFDERINDYEWSDDSSALYFSAAQKTNQYIFRIGLDGKVTTVDDRAGVAGSLSIAHGWMAWVYDNPNEPGEVHVAAIRANGRAASFRFTPRKLTDTNPQVKEWALGKTEVVRWKNKNDGMDMDGLLVLPPNYTAGTRVPLLLNIHGGPAGVFTASFSARRGVYPIQAWTSAGYAVFMPNPRGSGGYGEKFRKANVKDWGYNDYDDIQHGVDALIERGIADPDRMGIMGWSYGGYMTSWSITRTSRFKAASIGAPVTNLFSFWGTTDIPPFIESYFGARPWEDRELMAKHSAMYHLDKVKTPALIQHGTEDRRVPLAQGEELFTALRARGIPSELIKYPRQPHGITEPKLIRDGLMRNFEWFDRYVMGNKEAAKWHTTAPEMVAGGSTE
jgi:dipeptidyl aminopeptidase/acylaminoacyl peptidase